MTDNLRRPHPAMVREVETLTRWLETCMAHAAHNLKRRNGQWENAYGKRIFACTVAQIAALEALQPREGMHIQLRWHYNNEREDFHHPPIRSGEALPEPADIRRVFLTLRVFTAKRWAELRQRKAAA